VRQPALDNEPTDLNSIDGISVELNKNGVWIEVRHADGSWEAAFLLGSWLRWLAASTTAARRDAFELMRKSRQGAEAAES
jgi:tRNA threonylcarbamoyladenosine modification (KEOPS) complex  Pcc1 subunit